MQNRGDKEGVSLGYDVVEFPWYNTRLGANPAPALDFLSAIRFLCSELPIAGLRSPTVLRYVAQSARLIWIHPMEMAKTRFTLPSIVFLA